MEQQQFQQPAPGFAPPGAVPMQWVPQRAPIDTERRDRRLRFQGLCVRVAAFVVITIALIILIVQGSTYQVPTSRYSIYYPSSAYTSERFNFIALPIVVAAMLWNIAEFITYCVNRRGAHPGVRVGLDLIAFLSLAGDGACTIVFGPPEINTTVPYDFAIGSLQITSSGLHLSLFVMACIATYRRNKARNRPEAQYPPPPPGMVYMVPAQGQQPANFQTHTEPTASEMAGAGQTPHPQQHAEMMGDKATGVPQTGVPIQTETSAGTAAPPYMTSPVQTGVPIQTTVPVANVPPVATAAPPYTTGAAAQNPQPGVPAPTPMQGWTTVPVQPAAPMQQHGPPSQPANPGNTNNARWNQAGRVVAGGVRFGARLIPGLLNL